MTDITNVQTDQEVLPPEFKAALARKGQPLPMLDKDAAERRFQALVVSTYHRFENAQKATLDFYYQLGEALAEVTDATHAETYGEYRLKQFAVEFNAKGVVQLKSSSFKYARQFYQNMSPEAARICMEEGIVWSNVRELFSKRVTPELVDDTLSKIKAGELRQPEIKEYLDKQLGTPKRRVSKDPLDLINKVSSAFEELVDSVGRFGASAAKLFRGSPEEKKQGKIAVDTTEEMAKQMIKEWGDQLKIARQEQKRAEGSK